MKNRSLKAIAAEPFGTSHAVRSLQVPAVRALLALSLFLTCFLSASSAEAAPVIQLMTPQSGPVGTLVAIVGSGFGASQGTSTVTFNGTPVTWVSWSATSLQVQVPAGATSGSVVVTVSGKASNTKSFTVTPSPVITSFSPSSGPVGTTIAITGSNFTAGGTQSPQVVFNPELFASPISSTDTSISVAVPAGATTGDLLVSVGGGNSNAVLFNVTSSGPSISSLTPGAGVVGTAVTITGTNFGSSKGTSTVTFNEATGIPTSWSATSINVPVPAGATTGNLLVTVGGVESNPYGFEVGIAAPNITSISPASGAVATSVTIKGTGFGSTQGTNTVNFNGVSGAPTSWSATQIKVPVPTGATTGNVVVTASGTVSNGVNFTVPGTGPNVTGLSPSSGPVGTSLTINGTNFGATQGASTVTFNGLAAAATGWSATSIVVSVPSGAPIGNVNVVVMVGGLASNASGFQVVLLQPTITSVSPTSAVVGTSVTVTGTNFGATQGTSIVTFSGGAGTPASWSATSILVPVPSGATTGNVVVTVGGVASNGMAITVGTTPSITSLSPTSGAVGASVTITGANFGMSQGTNTVTFNGTTATPTSWNATSIVMPVPSGATSGPVLVIVAGVASNAVTFTLATPPSISATYIPGPNTNGWISSDVVVTYNCQLGNLALASCPSPQQINTEGQNQQITGTVTDTSGDSSSASVTLSIDMTGPVISILSPDDGSFSTSAGVSVTGSAADALSGIASVACNGVPTTLSSGNFSCPMTLAAGMNIVQIQATDNAGNVSATLLHLVLAAPLPNPNTLEITPSNPSVLVGGMQSFDVSDEVGNVRSGTGGADWGANGTSGGNNILPTWTVSDTSIATISNDPSPVLTGVAPGIVTLTAALGNVTAQTQVTVLAGTGGDGSTFSVGSVRTQTQVKLLAGTNGGASSFPVGTAVWSAPAVPGFTTQMVFQAVPTPNNTPDIYALDQDANHNALVRAFSADGRQLWKTNVPQYYYGNAMPDGLGGFLITSGSQIVDLDGQSGKTAFQSGPTPNGVNSLSLTAVGQDGHIYAVGEDYIGNGVFRLDPYSGFPSILARAPISLDTWDGTSCDGGPFDSFVHFDTTSSPIVGPDGSLALAYSTGYTSRGYAGLCEGGDPGGRYTNNVGHSGLMVVGPRSGGWGSSGTTFQTSSSYSNVTTISGGTTTYSSNSTGGVVVGLDSAGSPSSITPDGNGGYIALLQPLNPSDPVSFFDTTSGATYAVPSPLANTTAISWVVGETNNILATDGASVVAFDPLHGSPQWSYQPANGVNAIWPAEGGGAAILDGQSNQIPLDSSGNAGTNTNCPGAVSPLALSNWSALTNSSFNVTTCQDSEMGSSPWEASSGSLANQNASPKLIISTFIPKAPSTKISDPNFGSVRKTSNYLNGKIPKSLAALKTYIDSGRTVANIPSFTAANGLNPMDVLGFIGDSFLVNCNDPKDPNCWFSTGLGFTDNYLLRTPDCSLSGQTDGLCYDVDIQNYPPPCNTGAVLSSGQCYQQAPPCLPGAVAINSFCYRFTLQAQGQPNLTINPGTTPVLLTSAKVVFIGACDTTDIFTSWWDMNLNAGPEGRVLVVPDIAAMKALAINHLVVQNTPQYAGTVDLVQAAVGYQAFVKSLAAHHNVQDAVSDANDAIQKFYPGIDYSGTPTGTLPQVLYTTVGNANLCVLPVCTKE